MKSRPASLLLLGVLAAFSSPAASQDILPGPDVIVAHPLNYSPQYQSTTVTLGYGTGPYTFVAVPPNLPIDVPPGAGLTLVTGYTDNDATSVDWYKDDKRLDLSTSGSLVMITTASNSGIYRAVIHRAAGDIETERATIRIGRPPALPLLNLSTRATIAPSNRTLIAGFVIAPTPMKFNETKTVLIRGVGPSLAKFGVQTPLANPRTRIYDAKGVEVQQARAQVYLGYTAADLAAAVGAFPLLPGSTEFQDYLSLSPGAYSVHIDSPTGDSGEILVEIYEIPVTAFFPWAHFPQ
jgi:hypothetical protein